jgi:hypothetical protein
MFVHDLFFRYLFSNGRRVLKCSLSLGALLLDDGEDEIMVYDTEQTCVRSVERLRMLVCIYWRAARDVT